MRAGVRWGLSTGAFSASYTVLDATAVKLLSISPILLDYFGNLLRIPLMAWPVWRERASAAQCWSSQWRYALLGAVLGPLAYVSVLYAMRLAPLSHVAPMREVSLLFAALLGGTLLGETDRGPRMAGAACMVAGLIGLAWR